MAVYKNHTWKARNQFSQPIHLPLMQETHTNMEAGKTPSQHTLELLKGFLLVQVLTNIAPENVNSKVTLTWMEKMLLSF